MGENEPISIKMTHQSLSKVNNRTLTVWEHEQSPGYHRNHITCCQTTSSKIQPPVNIAAWRGRFFCLEQISRLILQEMMLNSWIMYYFDPVMRPNYNFVLFWTCSSYCVVRISLGCVSFLLKWWSFPFFEQQPPLLPSPLVFSTLLHAAFLTLLHTPFGRNT